MCEQGNDIASNRSSNDPGEWRSRIAAVDPCSENTLGKRWWHKLRHATAPA
jgi:hypothetical protein